jgi:hypothetical protein
MSTRSAVGVVVPGSDSWEGRYVHSDGWPSHMGRWLFHHLRKHDDPAQWLKSLLEAHPAGFSALFLCDPDKPPYRGDFNEYPSDSTVGPRCYCHSRNEPIHDTVYGHEDPRDMEYAYVTNGKTLFIHEAKNDGWHLVAQVPLSDEQFENNMPWEAIQGFTDGYQTWTWEEAGQ